jgi:hypothetical protein
VAVLDPGKRKRPPGKELVGMAVTVTLFLFGKPGQELNEGEEVTPEQLRALGQYLHERLDATATIVEKLTGAGWEAQMALYDIFLSHPYINTAAQAEAQLQDLGIDPEDVSIDEWEDEEEEFDEEEFGEDDEESPGVP